MDEDAATATATAAATDNASGMGAGLRRQPTKYPHGLNITVQTIDDNETNEDYSRASTLKSSASSNASNDSCWTDTQKYRIGMLGSPETLAELQVRRYKYPLTANYYLNRSSGNGSAPSHQQKPTPLMLLGYARRACRWKYLRWPIIFVASVLLFFGLITYCLWLHDLSVARARFLQRRYEATISSSSPPNSITTNDWTAGLSEENESSTEHFDDDNDLKRFTSTEHVHPLQESTRLRAVDMNREHITTETGAAALVESIEEGDADYDDVLLPADSIRFTSGHQNSFGVPIEQDKRMLQLLKDVSTRSGG